ncbi:hypothetical protein DAETH_04580 [Deinococcus aetherius]|uniref:Lipoprotein n=1 Tax=Deinococcus aetherius TaxID=200252 RepID=A0ABM8A9Q5_9DEIO|nr:hypothetical protein [Deinococcus aetherius]BDP40489.1 hypothetical protein DAETH_04580 [Deinococcus aetherius]
MTSVRRLLPLLTLVPLLTACPSTPGLVTVRDVVSPVLDREARLTAERRGTEVELVFSPGPSAARAVALFVGSSDPRALGSADPDCGPLFPDARASAANEPAGLRCILGDVAAGETRRLTVTGAGVSANATFYRSGSGAKPSLTYYQPLTR